MARVQWGRPSANAQAFQTGGIKPEQPKTGGIRALPNAQNSPQAFGASPWTGQGPQAQIANEQPFVPSGASAGPSPSAPFQMGQQANPTVTQAQVGSQPGKFGLGGSPAAQNWNQLVQGMPQTGGIKPSQAPAAPMTGGIKPEKEPAPQTGTAAAPFGPQTGGIRPSQAQRVHQPGPNGDCGPDHYFDPDRGCVPYGPNTPGPSVPPDNPGGGPNPGGGDCPPNQHRDGRGQCVWDDCPPGFDRQQSGECLPACPPGHSRTRDGECVPTWPGTNNPNGEGGCGPGQRWDEEQGRCVSNTGSGGGSGGGGPVRQSTAFPTLPPWQSTPPPEYQAPTFNAPGAFQAPTFDWNRQFQAPTYGPEIEFNAPEFQSPNAFQPPDEFSFNQQLNAPQFQFDEKWKPPTAEEAMEDPGFKFRLQQGLKAMENSAASRGNLRTGGTLKGLSDYAQDSASQEYQRVYDRRLQDLQTRYGMATQTHGINRQTALDQFDRAFDVAKTTYGANYDRSKGIFDAAMDLAKTKYGADYQGAFAEFASKIDSTRYQNENDWRRAETQYNKAFEAFMAQFAANYQGKRDEWQSAWDIAKEQFDTEFATSQAEFGPKMTAWQLEQQAKQREWELRFQAELDRWKWNNVSANTVFGAGLKWA